jgi:hypothetical protein
MQKPRRSPYQGQGYQRRCRGRQWQQSGRRSTWRQTALAVIASREDSLILFQNDCCSLDFRDVANGCSNNLVSERLVWFVVVYSASDWTCFTCFWIPVCLWMFDVSDFFAWLFSCSWLTHFHFRKISWLHILALDLGISGHVWQGKTLYYYCHSQQPQQWISSCPEWLACIKMAYPAGAGVHNTAIGQGKSVIDDAELVGAGPA